MRSPFASSGAFLARRLSTVPSLRLHLSRTVPATFLPLSTFRAYSQEVVHHLHREGGPHMSSVGFMHEGQRIQQLPGQKSNLRGPKGKNSQTGQWKMPQKQQPKPNKNQRQKTLQYPKQGLSQNEKKSQTHKGSHGPTANIARTMSRGRNPAPPPQPSPDTPPPTPVLLPSGREALLKSARVALADRFQSVRDVNLSYSTRGHRVEAVLQLPGHPTISTHATHSDPRQAKEIAALWIFAELHRRGLIDQIWEAPSLKSSTLLRSEAAISDVYNYCARHMLTPDVRFEPRKLPFTKKPAWIKRFSIRVPELGIDVSGESKELRLAEISAAIQFKAAVEGAVGAGESAGDGFRSPSSTAAKDEASELSLETAEQFHKWYKVKCCPGYSYDVAVEPASDGTHYIGRFTSTTKKADDQPVEFSVPASKKLDAEKRAYLHGAVAILKQDADQLARFSAALKMGLGRIRHPTSVVVHEHAVDVMARSVDAVGWKLRAGDAHDPALPAPVAVEASSQGEAQGGRSFSMTPEARDRLSEALSACYQQYLADESMASMRELKSSLPMNQYKDDVRNMIQDNVYSVIVGATGSGKTTQVPQIILEQYYRDRRGAECNVMCTQPRRIAATSVAKRVAEEMGPGLRDRVGHHVRFDVRRPRHGGSVTYCTTGILLAQLQSEPERVFDSFSHLIIDEVHERDQIIDFTLTILKRTIADRLARGLKVPRITLMSATLDTALFSSYFTNTDADGRQSPAPVLSVPGRTFPVTERYLGSILTDLVSTHSKEALAPVLADPAATEYLDLERAFSQKAGAAETGLGLLQPRRQQQQQQQQHSFGRGRANKRLDQRGNDNEGDDREPCGPSGKTAEALVPTGLVAAAICHILKTTDKGAILVFFPGLVEMQRVEKLLRTSPLLGVHISDASMYRMYMLHSSIPEAQKTVFESVPGDVRKVILSTNIGETSITIPDVRYVIDTGKLRETRYDHVKRISSLELAWVSKSNAKQRAGRAGRVQDGHYLGLYSEARHRSLRAVGLPELLRADLQTTCLTIKSSIRGIEIAEFLAQAIEPPSAVAVTEAIRNLVGLGALTPSQELTPLGQLLASLPVHPTLGKMVVLGIIFQCLDPIIVIAAAAEERSLFITAPAVKAESLRRKIAYAGYDESDHFASYKAFCELRNTPEFSRKMVAINNLLHMGAFSSIHGAASQMVDIFVQFGLIPPTRDRKSHWSQGPTWAPAQSGPDAPAGLFGGPQLNTNSHKAHIVKAILLAGLQPNMAISNHGTIWRTTEHPTAVLPQTSVLNTSNRRNKAPSRENGHPKDSIVTYTNLVKSTDGKSVFLRDTSTVDHLAVALFAGNVCPSTPIDDSGRLADNSITVNEWLEFLVKASRSSARSSIGTAKVLLAFRRMLDRVLVEAFADIAGADRGEGAAAASDGPTVLHGNRTRDLVVQSVVWALDASAGLGSRVDWSAFDVADARHNRRSPGWRAARNEPGTSRAMEPGHPSSSSPRFRQDTRRTRSTWEDGGNQWAPSLPPARPQYASRGRTSFSEEPSWPDSRRDARKSPQPSSPDGGRRFTPRIGW